MEELHIQAIMSSNLRNAIDAIEGLGGFGNYAIPELLKISDIMLQQLVSYQSARLNLR